MTASELLLGGVYGAIAGAFVVAGLSAGFYLYFKATRDQHLKRLILFLISGTFIIGQFFLVLGFLHWGMVRKTSPIGQALGIFTSILLLCTGLFYLVGVSKNPRKKLKKPRNTAGKRQGSKL